MDKLSAQLLESVCNVVTQCTKSHNALIQTQLHSPPGSFSGEEGGEKSNEKELSVRLM